MAEQLIIEKNLMPGITEITLNRPEKRNALNIGLLDELKDALIKINEDSRVRVMLLRGAGRVFCSGLDLSEALDPAKAIQSADKLANILYHLHKAPFVTISLVQGACLAGGCGLMAACDITIAEDETVFGFPEVKRGLVPALITPFLAGRLKGADIKELLLLGELLNAQKAKEIGLIHRTVKKGELLSESLKLSKHVLKGAPRAIAQTKIWINRLLLKDFESFFKEALKLHVSIRESDEAKEGITSFIENRIPAWEKNVKMDDLL